jgi:hypothetical protein
MLALVSVLSLFGRAKHLRQSRAPIMPLPDREKDQWVSEIFEGTLSKSFTLAPDFSQQL